MSAIFNYGPWSVLLGAGGATKGAALKLSAANTAVVATAGTDEIIGLAGDTGSAGDYIPVQAGPVQIGLSSAAISAGAKLTATTGGKLVTTTTDGDTVVGFALEAAGAANEQFQVVIPIGFRNTAP
jgi:hypothetical protein